MRVSQRRPKEAGMKVIAVRQPWAWLIIHANKDIENRTWATRYRGKLLIQASVSMPTQRDLEEARRRLEREQMVSGTDWVGAHPAEETQVHPAERAARPVRCTATDHSEAGGSTRRRGQMKRRVISR